MDLFFVISGFILLYTQLEKKRSVKEFLLLRAIRIIPIYWLLTFILFFLYIFIPFVFREMVITWNWVFTSLLFMSNNLLGKPPVVLVGWTLELEMIFYLILGLSLWFKNWTTILTSTFLVLITISLLSGNFILMEFVAGMFIALFFKKYELRYFAKISLLIGVFLLLLSLNYEVKIFIENRLILWGIPSFFIVYGAVASKQIKISILKLIGDSSYSIYLIQTLSIPFFFKILNFTNVQINADFLVILSLTFTVISGIIIYRYIEKPLISYVKRLFMSKKYIKD